jgi:hypothetical protein
LGRGVTILCGRIVRVLDLTGTGAGPGAATEVPVEAPKDVGVGGVVQGPALVPVPVSDFEPAPALVELRSLGGSTRPGGVLVPVAVGEYSNTR